MSGDGTTALVTAGGDDTDDVYVFESTAEGWTHAATLSPPRPNSQDGFGGGMALSDDGVTALVGAPRDDTAAGEGVGVVYAFARTASGWTRVGTLSNPEPDSRDDFGTAVALSGDGTTALVGAPNDGVVVDAHPTIGNYAGTAYVFESTAEGWTHAATLPNPLPGHYDFFGAAVALNRDGSTALVASTFFDEAVPGGEAYVFESTAEGWTRVATLSDPESDVDDGFGAAVALSGDGATALVGVPYDDTPDGDRPGEVCAFVRTDSGWTFADVLSNPNPDPYDRFGRILALSDDGSTVLVGDPQESSAEDGGAAYVFARSDSEWSHAATLSNPEPDPDDSFGSGVALSHDGAIALVGAPGDDTAAGEDVGVVYTFTTEVFPAPITLKNGDEVTPKDRDGDGLYEDLDGDGGTDGRDVQFLARLANDCRKGRVRLTDAQVEALDFDGDGAFTKADVRAYARTYL